ncbi:MAG: site-specific DNA-methyltransferase [Candidatus Poribacteria bacterium]|nr:site-specific DNA-methyltransferase [Candidatus Poribacteria bacterium]
MPTLEFNGKHHIYTHHLTVPYEPLETDKSRSCNPTDADDNLIIHGDNLHALKALLPRYTNRIKCIYIDPPYNTGNEGWIYNDNVNSPLIKQWFTENAPVDNEDLERHDKWLCMMWPRLHLLKELLAEDGIIFISIDDNEVHHLRMMMDEILGAENFLADIIWQHRYGRSNNAKLFSNQREHVVAYRKSDTVSHIRVKRDKKLNETYSNPDDDPRGSWVSSSYVNPAQKGERPNLVYSVVNPHTGESVNHPTHAWKYSQSTHEKHVRENRLWWGIDGKLRYPRLKNFLSESEEKGIVPIDLMLADIAGTTDEGTKQLQSVFQSTALEFNNPKPTKLIAKLIEIAEGASKKNDTIILDSFAGSGTTAHAVLALNKEDGGNRKFILIECEDYADTTTAERVRRVINGVPDASDDTLREGLGGSFTYCTLGEPIEVEAMLTGEKLPTYTALATNLLFTSAGISVEAVTLEEKNDDGLFYTNDKNDYYLIYKPDLEYLRSNEAILNLEHAKRIQDASHENGKKAIVYAADNYIGQRELTKMGIAFCQLPYIIHER